jgi:hypothetical protein
MTDKKHENTIDSLVGKLEPVTPLRPAHVRAFLWVLLHTIIIFIGMMLVQPFMQTAALNAMSPYFWFENSLWIVAIALATYFSFASTIPGAFKFSNWKLCLIPVGLIALSLLTAKFSGQKTISSPQMRPYCEVEILLFSLLPMVHLGLLMKKGVLLRSSISSLLAGLSALLIPTALMHFACGHNPTHFILFHLTPLLGGALLFSQILKRYILNRNKTRS